MVVIATNYQRFGTERDVRTCSLTFGFFTGSAVPSNMICTAHNIRTNNIYDVLTKIQYVCHYRRRLIQRQAMDNEPTDFGVRITHEKEDEDAGDIYVSIVYWCVLLTKYLFAYFYLSYRFMLIL